VYDWRFVRNVIAFGTASAANAGVMCRQERRKGISGARMKIGYGDQHFRVLIVSAVYS